MAGELKVPGSGTATRLHARRITPTLETLAIGEATFRAARPESNGASIAGRPLEDRRGATAGSSRCRAA